MLYLGSLFWEISTEYVVSRFSQKDNRLTNENRVCLHQICDRSAVQNRSVELMIKFVPGSDNYCSNLYVSNMMIIYDRS
jgi:hypothetical protein